MSRRESRRPRNKRVAANALPLVPFAAGFPPNTDSGKPRVVSVSKQINPPEGQTTGYPDCHL